jgi:hypothetical protein
MNVRKAEFAQAIERKDVVVGLGFRRQSTSICDDPTNWRIISIRKRTELIFQVAIRSDMTMRPNRW